jgi:hypothetical protein
VEVLERLDKELMVVLPIMVGVMLLELVVVVVVLVHLAQKMQALQVLVMVAQGCQTQLLEVQ